MKYFYLIGFALVFSCTENKSSTKKNEGPAQPSTQEISKSTKDTVLSVHKMSYNEIAQSTTDTSIYINQDSYKIITEAKVSFEDTLLVSQLFEGQDKIFKDIYKGLNVHYSIQIFDQNEDLIFDQFYDKNDFVDSISGLVIESNAYAPRFEVYSASNHSLYFTLDFSRNQSCLTDQAFIKVDLKKNKAMHDYHTSFGGSGGDCAFQLSKNSQSLLSCTEFITESGRTIPFAKKNQNVIGAFFINHRNILVIYDEQDSSISNAHIINSYGKTTHSFRYDGSYNMLNHQVPRTFLNDNNTLYLLDENLERLVGIQSETDINPRFYEFNELKQHVNFESESTTYFKINTEVGMHWVEIDSKGKIIAYQSGSYE